MREVTLAERRGASRRYRVWALRRNDRSPPPPYPWLAPQGEGWTSGPPETLSDNPWFAVERYRAIAPTGAPAAYYVGYIATHLTPCEAAPEDTEALAVARVPFREALHAAVTGHIQDAIAVAMLLRAHHMAVERELPPALAAIMLRR